MATRITRVRIEDAKLEDASEITMIEGVGYIENSSEITGALLSPAPSGGQSPYWQWFWDLSLFDQWLLEWLQSLEVPIPIAPPVKPFPVKKALGVVAALGLLGAGAYALKKYMESK